MPEYSSTTITPSDGVQVPGMNGSTSGNFLLSALRDFILASKGQANGLASLGSDGKLTASQLPDLADDVIVVASYATLPAIGTAGKIYITADNNKMYRWDPDLTTPNYVELSVDLSAYATKAELAAEESARESEDSNLKSAIDANSNRISNLEQEHGGYVTVNYRGTNDVPTGKAKYALVESIVGKSRAWNQLVEDNVSKTYSQSVTEYSSGKGFANLDILDLSSIPEGHYILVMMEISNASSNLERIQWNRGGNSSQYTSAGSYATIETYATGSYYFIRAYTSDLNNFTVTLKVAIRDLTLIFPEGVPSTVAECVQKCPDILKYDAFGTSIVDTTVEGVKSRGKNLFKESSMFPSNSMPLTDGYYTGSTSSYGFDFGFTFKPNTQYTFTYKGHVSANNVNARFHVYYTDGTGANTSIMQSTTDSEYTWTSEAGKSIAYITKDFGNGGTVYLLYLQVEEGATATAYSPYMESTLTLPSSVTLRSAGTVAEVYDLETGKKTNPLGEVDMGTLSWTCDGTFLETYLTGKKIGINALLCPRYITSYVQYATQMVDGEIRGHANSTLVTVKDSSKIDPNKTNEENASAFKTAMDGVILLYELATPDDPTQLTPVIDNTIQTEGGGTIETIQTQTPVIDNSMDVGYLAL